MIERCLFTIGHGNRNEEEFLSLLVSNKVQFLVDVRSKPYSRNSQYNKEVLDSILRNRNIVYIYMGDLLGGHPSDKSCYKYGCVDYTKLRETAAFIQGIKRLEDAYKKNYRIAIMCSESKPQDCHRTKLIAHELYRNNITVNHIDEHGHLVSHQEVMNKITGGQITMFADHVKLSYSKKL